MPQINLSTYEQSEEIKSNLETMLETIIENSGTNFSKYEPFSFQDGINIASSDFSYKKALEINGGGYLSVGALRGDTGGNAIKITIDGVVVLETSALSNSYVTGFVTSENLSSISPNQTVINIQGITYTISNPNSKFIPEFQVGVSFVSSQFLFFKESLLIECRRVSGNTGGLIQNWLAGGKLK